MARKKKNNKRAIKEEKRAKKGKHFSLPPEAQRLIWIVVMFLAAAIITLAFFNLSGDGGKMFMKSFNFLVGKTVFFLPLLLVLGGLAFLSPKYQNKWPVFLAFFFLLLGLAGTFECFKPGVKQGGWLGYLTSLPLLKAFGIIATQVIWLGLIVAGAIILWQFLHRSKPQDEKEKKEQKEEKENKKIFGPSFKVKALEPPLAIKPEKPSENKVPILDIKTRPQDSLLNKNYKLPPVDLLESDKGMPLAGDIKINSAIIKRTLQNFDIQVEMSEVNIGPTVTQYTLKPAEGVKLNKITTLSNDLSLALAAHPLRIEAPIPGRPLVGIEVPNKSRTMVRLKNMMENPNFQNAPSNLTLVLGRDVSGNAVFANLGKMPHLLVAGATGTGKTICLNTIILSLLYQNSPETLRLIMIDPKRVEFPVYRDLPHLLTPVILDPQKSVNAFKWLITEMERRFDVLSQKGARDIGSYNEKMTKDGEEIMPYIVLIVDELADLMMARGREIEAGIVRLAQMARAVGIHLILATQRPSVEVITGLIKANITSRITFQVASQVDSRTVLDASGAEKLLGLGDMLFISAEISKPKRIQGAYVSDKEVKKVTQFIKDENGGAEATIEEEISKESSTMMNLEKTMEEVGDVDMYGGGDDPLYEEAKKLVIEAKKASASLLQRRLRVEYARAARLIDMLEEKGVVGPGEGAKPREIYSSGVEEGLKAPVIEGPVEELTEEPKETEEPAEDEDWKKV
jgi:S-DNA-T family DNA segregation ATPase FtsK/SpoIIIE